MMNYTKIYIAFLVFCTLLGCKKVELPGYELGGGIGFYRDGIMEGRDSLTRSFAVLELDTQTDTVVLPLRILGTTMGHDRVVEYEIDSKLTTAPLENFELLEAIVPANSFAGTLKVKVNKTEVLKTKEYRIALQLKTSDLFQNGPKDRRTYLIKINDFLTKPVSWDNARFGEYSQVKYGLIIRLTGYNDFSTVPIDVRYYIVGKCRNALIDYEQEHKKKMMDENNVEVRFP